MVNFLFVAVIAIFFVILSSSLVTSQVVQGIPMKNPINLPTGTWIINAGGQKGELNITKVADDGQITGTLRFGVGGVTESYSKIFGLWDFDSWKITFLKENKLFFKDPSRTVNCNVLNSATREVCHGRDQVFTGYLFGGLPCPSQCEGLSQKVSLGGIKASENDPLKGPVSSIVMAGTFEAFGGTAGTGATADRSVFGWVADYPGNQVLTHPTQTTK